MKKALIVQGGWEGHEPKESAEVFRKILEEEGFETEISDTLDSFTDRERLKSLDLIVPHWTMGTITPEQLEPVLDAVAGGVGIAGCHAGMCDAFHDSVDWQWMTGGQWVSHNGGQHARHKINIIKGTSCITEGIEDFYVETEQYLMHVDPSNEVLATTRFPIIDDVEVKTEVKLEGGFGEWNFNEDTIKRSPAYLNQPCQMPVIWTKRWGVGKVFYCSLGHNAALLDTEPVRTIMKRGFLWAAGVLK